MANVKITDLTAYTTPASTDVLPIVDVGADVTKKVSIADLLENAGSGTASAPGIAFDGDSNTGIYRPGADQLAISTGGSQALLIDASGNVTAAGTSTADSFIPTSSSVPTNGMYLPAANSVALATNGTERVEFGTSEVVFNDGGEDYDFRIEGDTEANLVFVDASTNRVGLGTNSPVADLDIAPAASSATLRVQARSNASPVSAIELMRGASTTFGQDLYADYRIKNDNARLVFEYAESGTTTERMRIDLSGNVGIGTTSPGSALEIDAAAATSPFIAKINTSEAARIDSSGRLLIGRSTSLNADSLLQVYKASGETRIRCDSDSLGDGESSTVEIYGGNRFAAIGVRKIAGNTNPAGYVFLGAQDGANSFIWTDDSDQLRISTNGNNIGTTGGTVVGTQTSDERVKNILGPVTYGLSTLQQIEPVRYSLKSDPDVEKLGFIAQQVQPLVPQSVFDTGEHIEGEPKDAPTKLGMEYVALIPILVNAVKELSAEVNALKAQLQAS